MWSGPIYFFKYFLIFLHQGSAAARGIPIAACGSGSPTGDRMPAPCSGSAVFTTGPGKPLTFETTYVLEECSGALLHEGRLRGLPPIPPLAPEKRHFPALLVPEGPPDCVQLAPSWARPLGPKLRDTGRSHNPTTWAAVPGRWRAGPPRAARTGSPVDPDGCGRDHDLASRFGSAGVPVTSTCLVLPGSRGPGKRMPVHA